MVTLVPPLRDPLVGVIDSNEMAGQLGGGSGLHVSVT